MLHLSCLIYNIVDHIYPSCLCEPCLRYYLRQRLTAQFRSSDAESITSGASALIAGNCGLGMIVCKERTPIAKRCPKMVCGPEPSRPSPYDLISHLGRNRQASLPWHALSVDARAAPNPSAVSAQQTGKEITDTAACNNFETAAHDLRNHTCSTEPYSHDASTYQAACLHSFPDAVRQGTAAQDFC